MYNYLDIDLDSYRMQTIMRAAPAPWNKAGVQSRDGAAAYARLVLRGGEENGYFAIFRANFWKVS